MDRIINVRVGGNHLSKDNKNAGVRGEANVTNLRITFDEGWENYAKTVTFWDAHGNNPVKRIQGVDLIEDIATDAKTYITPIPKEPLAIAGELTFVIDGYLDGKRQRSISDKLIVKDAPITDNAEEPTDPTPTQAEQLQGEIDKIKGDIQEAYIARNEAVLSAKNALKQAAAAEASATIAKEAVGKTSYIGENGNWFAWDSSISAFYDTGVKAQAGSTVYCGDNPPPEADVWIDLDGTSSLDLAKLYAKVNELEEKLPRKITINLPASAWVEDAYEEYSQVVAIAGVTPYSQIDLQITKEQLAIFREKDISFWVENEDGVVTACCLGQKPTNDYVVQATKMEVIVDE